MADNASFGDLCRLCASKTSLLLAINIFENEGALRQLNKKIETCLPVQVHEADELPKMVCENCVLKLELFSDFRDRSIRTERLLIDLFKQINNANKMHADSQSLSVVTMDQNELIMVQHPLLNDSSIQNVSDVDLEQLGHREGMIVGHEIILTHHSLNNIDLHNHDLTNQDLSNQSLQTQDAMMVESGPDGHGIQVTRFTDDLIQQDHHLLADQFRLQQELHMEPADAVGVTNLHISDDELKATSYANSQTYSPDEKLSVITEEDSKHVPTPEDQYNYNKENDLKFDEDSNSGNTLLVDEELNDMQMEKPLYLMPTPKYNDSDAKDWFYCNVCGKNYEHQVEFEKHYETHFHKCTICLAMFTTEETLNNHRKEVHGLSEEEIKAGKGILKETITKVDAEGTNNNVEIGNGKGEDDEEELDDPGESSNNKRKKWSPKECKVCGKTYKTNYKLTEHMRKHTGEKPYKCNSCEKTFRSKIGLAQHEAKHTGQYDYSCPTCGKGFQCKSYLMVHQRVHSDVKPYPCTTCGQNFKTKQSLVDHTNRHLGVKPYICDICGRGFITRGLCKAHQKVHSGLDNRKYSCKICTKMFVSKSYLQTHLRIHTGEKPFMCEVCGKGFLTRVDLRIHSTMHTGEKSYVCDLCGKAFARRDALRCHRRSHTGERPYSCELCGQTFTQFTPMAIHKRLHTGERPYSCETCGKAFVSRSTMMAHAKKHNR